MSGQEVLTIQLGNYANHVGSHFWNIQDELVGLAFLDERSPAAEFNANVLFRVEEDVKGHPIYTPRTIIFDIQGSLGGMQSRERVAAPPAVSTWAGPVAVHRAPPVPRSAFVEQLEYEEEEEADADADRARREANRRAGPSRQPDAAAIALREAARQLSTPGAVRSWTDYLKVNLHPRSICLLPGTWQGGAGNGALELSAEMREAALDRVRVFAEECDTLQGMHVLLEDLGGFGQVAADLLGEVRDEYTRTPLLLFAYRKPEVRRAQQIEAAGFARLAPLASLLVPMASQGWLPHIRLDAGSDYQTAAALAGVTDTMTLPWRLQRSVDGYCDVHSIANLLAGGGRNHVAVARAAFPCPEVPPEQAAAAASDARTNSVTGARAEPFTRAATICWTPGFTEVDGLRAELLVLRGSRRGGVRLPRTLAAAALDRALVQEGARCVQQHSVVAQPLPIPLPFPQFFDACVSRFGDVRPCAVRAHGNDVESLPLLSRLGVGDPSREYAARQLAVWHELAGSALGRAALAGWDHGAEETEGILEELHTLAESGSDTGSSDDA